MPEPQDARYQVDRELHNAIPYGALSRLAEHRGVSVESVARYYNPHNPEYQSIFSKALLELRVIKRVSPDWARGIVKVFNRFDAAWCEPSERPQVNTDLETVSTLAAKLSNPLTPDRDRMPLALELQRRANAIVAGLQFEDREDSPEDGRGKVAAIAR